MVNAALRNSQNGSFTYADYCKWDDSQGQRWELIDGWAYAMVAPSRWHQKVLVELIWRFRTHLDGKDCEVYIAPFDVRLNYHEADDIVVQPDLLVVCDLEKLADNKSVKGAPDLVIEVLSPSTAKHDKVTKFRKYRQYGVREAWFVEPELGFVEVCKRVGDCGEYTTIPYDTDHEIAVGILPDLTIGLAEIFDYLIENTDETKNEPQNTQNSSENT